MLKTTCFSLVLVVLNFWLITNSAQAQESKFIPCSGTTCTECHFVQMGNAIIVWLIAIMFLIFAVMAFSAGWKLITSTGNTQAVTDAKSKLSNAIIGLIIVLAGWLLVDTIMRGLLKGGTGEIEGYGLWSRVECGEQFKSGIVREGKTAEDPGQDGVVPPSDPSPGTTAHSDAVTALGSNFTLVSSGSCSDKNNPKCTSLDGVRDQTIDRIKELQSTVGVPLVITGGTEVGHSEKGEYTHGNGYKIDIRPTPALNDYIYENFEKIGPTKYKDGNGNTYYRHEPDHWDITITN